MHSRGIWKTLFGTSAYLRGIATVAASCHSAEEEYQQSEAAIKQAGIAMRSKRRGIGSSSRIASK